MPKMSSNVQNGVVFPFASRTQTNFQREYYVWTEVSVQFPNWSRQVLNPQLAENGLDLTFDFPSLERIHLSHDPFQTSLLVLSVVEHEEFILTNELDFLEVAR